MYLLFKLRSHGIHCIIKLAWIGNFYVGAMLTHVGLDWHKLKVEGLCLGLDGTTLKVEGLCLALYGTTLKAHALLMPR